MLLYNGKREECLELSRFAGVPLGISKLNNKNQPTEVLPKGKGYN